jgi:hypothetical protein
MKPEQLALAAHVESIVRIAGKVKGESDDHHRVKAMTIPAATLVVAIALGGLFAPAAVRASEYCSEVSQGRAQAVVITPGYRLHAPSE